MTDYTEIIQQKMWTFPEISECPTVILRVNQLLNIAEQGGLEKLVQYFTERKNPDRAFDYLFELWLYNFLQRNPLIDIIDYEPPTEGKRPDFRLVLNGVQFDIQVKRMWTRGSLKFRTRFQKECAMSFSHLKKYPWFINFWLSTSFRKEHVRPFFDHLQHNIRSFSPVQSLLEDTRRYQWESQHEVLAQFSITENSRRGAKISPGLIKICRETTGSFKPFTADAMRKAVAGKLNAARGSLLLPITNGQANIVLIQPEDHLGLTNAAMANALYGDGEILQVSREDDASYIRQPRGTNGLFYQEELRPNRHYDGISGVILVPSPREIPLTADTFVGEMFPNPLYLNEVANHPKPFAEMSYTQAWKRE